MNVYHISSGYDGCFYVRCILPMLANGWNGNWKGFNSKVDSQEQLLDGVKKADVIVFQRPLVKSYYDLALVLQKMGKIIVYDNDDTYVPNSGTPLTMTGFGTEEQIKKAISNMDSNLKDFARMADLVTVSTDYLAGEYEKNKTVVLRNCIDVANTPVPLKNTSGLVRIGIMGSILYSEDYKLIEGILEGLSERDDVTLVLFGLPANDDKNKLQIEKLYSEQFAWKDKINCEWHPVVNIVEYMAKLNELRLDLILIPRIDNYFNRCKSNLKFLEASILEIPCICSSFPDHNSPYEVNKEDTKHLVLCANENEWKYNIDKLLNNKELRDTIGKGAREYVINNYNITANAHKWAEAYQNIWNLKQNDL